MSNVPMHFRDWWNDYDLGVDVDSFFSRPRTSRLIDQHFGTAIRRNDLLSSLANTQISASPRSPYYIRPWGTALSRQDSGSTINVDKNKFQIILDVQQFTPNEITVKTNDKFIIIEGNEFMLVFVSNKKSLIGVNEWRRRYHAGNYKLTTIFRSISSYHF